MKELKEWLHNTINQMQEQKIKSITGNHHYLNAFNS